MRRRGRKRPTGRCDRRRGDRVHLVGSERRAAPSGGAPRRWRRRRRTGHVGLHVRRLRTARHGCRRSAHRGRHPAHHRGRRRRPATRDVGEGDRLGVAPPASPRCARCEPASVGRVHDPRRGGEHPDARARLPGDADRCRSRQPRHVGRLGRPPRLRGLVRLRRQPGVGPPHRGRGRVPLPLPRRLLRCRLHGVGRDALTIARDLGVDARRRAPSAAVVRRPAGRRQPNGGGGSRCSSSR